MKTPLTIDGYIRPFPADVRKILERIRRIIREAAPQSVEKISYRIPTLTLNGRYLMYFAAYKNHVSLYPIPSGPDEFQKELKPYVKSKGTIPFPLDRPVPYDLVKKIAKLHVRGHTAGS